MTCKQHFGWIKNDNLFYRDKIDVVCVQFIYMNILHMEIYSFVDIASTRFDPELRIKYIHPTSQKMK